MTTLQFVLSPEAITRMYDSLQCLLKFGETVGLEASREKLCLVALNSSSTASACCYLENATFFQSYRFSAPATPGDSRFRCTILNKALISVFKGRVADGRESDTSVERCEINLQDHPEKTECRLVIKMICKHGVKKTYRLTYESSHVPRAVFDKNSTKNRWTIGAYILKAFSEFFGARTEYLDLYHDADRMHCTSYTEKITNGAQILKQPLHTSIAIDVLDFDDFKVEEDLHVSISVKDFKAVVTHADSLKSQITALYSYPTRPLQLSYGVPGMLCEVTLMTIGEYRGSSITPASTAQKTKPFRLVTKQGSTTPAGQRSYQQTNDSMPPPLQSASRSFGRDTNVQQPSRPSPPLPLANIHEEPLFVTDDEEEQRQWGETNYDVDEGELRWDSAGTSFQKTSLTQGPNTEQYLSRNNGGAVEDQRIAPTQRMSEIRGIFDE